MARLPTKPLRMPRSAVRVVRTVRKISNSNTMSNVLTDVQNAVVKCFTKDISFVLMIAAVIFLATVNLFDIKNGPMASIFVKYIDTTIGKWCAINVMKMNGIVTLAPVIFKFKPSARLAAAAAIITTVIVLQPAHEYMYGAAAACVLAAMELKHPINIGLMLSALTVIIGITAWHKAGPPKLGLDLTQEEWNAILNAREKVRPRRSVDQGGYTANDWIPESEEIEV